MSDFIHLHVHSHYSLLDGLPKISQLLDKAQEFGMPALALTDHGVMYGALEFYTKAKEKGINPIVGLETYIAPRSIYDRIPKIDTNPYHLTLLAKDYQGYLNLMKLTTIAHLEGYYYKPRLDKEILSNHSQGLIALSGCLKGEIPRLLISGNFKEAEKVAKKYSEIFSGDFYLELMDLPKIKDQVYVNKELIKLSKKTNIPLVATCDVHYLLPEDAETQDVLLCIQTGSFVTNEERMKMKEGNFSFRSAEEMKKAFSENPQAIKNTLKIAEKCNLEIPLNQILLPNFKVSSGEDEFSHLKKLAEKGLFKRYEGKVPKEAQKRLEYELSVIKKTGFSAYFLIVADFVNFAKKNGIMVGPGRGSAAGSLVSFALGITEINPLLYGLVFERFLNPDRIAMPDIDIDFADHRREEVILYLAKKYGKNNVAQIITFGTMAARAAVRDVGRVLGMPYLEVDKIAKLVPFNLPLRDSIKTVSDLKNLYEQDQKIRKLLDIACSLEGVARHASTHAAGVVISQDELLKYLPLQKSTGEGFLYITQYTMYDIEKIGLLKIDILGLSNLSILENALEITEAVFGKKINLFKIPFDDKKTYKLLSSGETVGVFQLESAGMQRYLKELKPTNFEDIISIVALYRPGPLENITSFIASKHGRKKVSYFHPSLKPILESTYGVIVTQEQVLEIARKFAGFTYSEADILRKAVGKKNKKLLSEQRKKFIEGAIKTSNVRKELAEKVWNFIEPFARYGFNKSHATCYALIAYWTAYLKAHFPSCFMAALLTAEKNDIEKVAKGISECQRMGIEVLPPSLNESFSGFAVVPQTGHIRYALSAIKNVGETASKAIVRERKNNGPYKSLEDFLKRNDSKYLNKKVLESLIKAGALDEFSERGNLLVNLDQILSYVLNIHKNFKNGQQDLFSSTQIPEIQTLHLRKTEPIEKEQKLVWEKELLGLYLSAHPLDDYEDYLRSVAISILKVKSLKQGSRVKVGGIITNIQRILTRQGEEMLFATLEDKTGKLEILVFPKVLEENPKIWQKENIILVEGTKSVGRGEEPKVICQRAEVVFWEKIKKEGFSAQKNKKFIIKVPLEIKKEDLSKIQKILEKYPGREKVILEIDGKRLEIPFGVDLNPNLKVEIKKILQNIKKG